jgi:2-amino-4-hydroxy-6-hydroxymethyldihydropteridine diphosphokinase
MGDRKQLLSQALALVEKGCGRVVQASKIHETKPWGFEAERDFLNQALLVETTLLPLELLRQCQEIERALGRIRNSNGERYSSRPIDIDILFYEDVVCETPELTLPHPRLHLRKFALEPLIEVASEWVHPHLNATASDLFGK